MSSQFAKAGFFHAPGSEAVDQVKCFSCDKVLSGWGAGEDPLCAIQYYCRQSNHLCHSQEHVEHGGMKCSYIMARKAEMESGSARPSNAAETVGPL